MAKKLKKSSSHKVESFMVRLPVAYRLPLSKIKAKTRRSITAELQVALDKHLHSEGVAVPVVSI